jgi:hypothetical protein
MLLDIQNLYITQGELKKVAEISDRDLKAYDKLNKYPRFALLILIGEYAQQILLLGWGLIPLGYLIKWQWFRKRQKKILEEVDKYNTVVKAIEINQQLVAAGNQDLNLANKEKVIATLTTTRENIIRALKTERILSKNRAFIEHNRELLVGNLIALEALQVTQKVSEYTEMLDNVLQIAQSVQAEMKQLEEDSSL